MVSGVASVARVSSVANVELPGAQLQVLQGFQTLIPK